jgi:imidazolonepropionase
MAQAQLFRGISKLITLREAAAHSARKFSELSILKRAAIIEKDQRIVWAGNESKIPREFFKTQIRERDLQGAIVLPAFVECHTHLVFAGSRAHEFELRNRGASYFEIGAAGGGILSTLQATRQASAQALLASAQKRADRFAEQGVATVECKSGYGLSWPAEQKILKVAHKIKGPRVITTFLGAHAIPKEFINADAYIDHLIQLQLPLLKKSGLAKRVDIFTEKGYFSLEVSRRYLREAKALGFDVVIHADQLTRTGATALAVELGAKSADHLLHLDDNDITKIAKSNVTAVLLPTSDLYMSTPYPPARALLDRGARVALATDFNPGSAPSQDLSLTGVIARAQMKMTLNEVLIAYTLGGAHALGLQAEIGSVEVGKFCDITVLNCEVEDLFYSVGQHTVSQTWRGGRRIF